MGIRGFQLKFILPFLAIACCCPGTAFAAGVVDPRQPTQPTETADSDSPDFIRSHTWESSFDRAGDATRDAELELKSGRSVTCNQEDFQTVDATPELVEQRMAECIQLQQQALGYSKDVEGIRKMQRTFANVSRASDLAAVGAIGAVGYGELIKKDSSQSSSLKSVAKIQETAGYVSYATGAADISMGAYALAAQKKKLDKIQKTLSGITKSGVQLNEADSALVSKLATAAEKTKAAAYSHMAYGAGKVAVGYASMWLADKNRKTAESLESIDTFAFGTPAASATSTVSTTAGGTAYYQNNDSQIGGIVATSSTTATDTDTSFSGAGSGASVMPSEEFRTPSSLGGGRSASGLGSAIGAGSAKPAGGGEGDAPALEDTKAAEAKEALGNNFEVSLGGGGGSRYGGGGKSDSEAEATGPAGVLESVAGGKSSATGVNPNSLYNEALEGLDGQEGSMAGVSGSGQSLFAVIKAKYNKMVEGGRVQGPGAVEVRN